MDNLETPVEDGTLLPSSQQKVDDLSAYKSKNSNEGHYWGSYVFSLISLVLGIIGAFYAAFGIESLDLSLAWENSGSFAKIWFFGLTAVAIILEILKQLNLQDVMARTEQSRKSKDYKTKIGSYIICGVITLLLSGLGMSFYLNSKKGIVESEEISFKKLEIVSDSTDLLTYVDNFNEQDSIYKERQQFYGYLNSQSDEVLERYGYVRNGERRLGTNYNRALQTAKESQEDAKAAYNEAKSIKDKAESELAVKQQELISLQSSSDDVSFLQGMFFSAIIELAIIWFLSAAVRGERALAMLGVKTKEEQLQEWMQNLGNEIIGAVNQLKTPTVEEEGDTEEELNEDEAKKERKARFTDEYRQARLDEISQKRQELIDKAMEEIEQIATGKAKLKSEKVGDDIKINHVPVETPPVEEVVEAVVEPTKPKRQKRPYAWKKKSRAVRQKVKQIIEFEGDLGEMKEHELSIREYDLIVSKARELYDMIPETREFANKTFPDYKKCFEKVFINREEDDQLFKAFSLFIRENGNTQVAKELGVTVSNVNYLKTNYLFPVSDLLGIKLTPDNRRS